jgi:hypothetical protein
MAAGADSPPCGVIENPHCYRTKQIMGLELWRPYPIDLKIKRKTPATPLSDL